VKPSRKNVVGLTLARALFASLPALALAGCFGSVDYENQYTEQQPRQDNQETTPSPVVAPETTDSAACDDAAANCQPESNNPPVVGPNLSNPPPVPYIPNPHPGVDDPHRHN
jgi:hypothetical protein